MLPELYEDFKRLRHERISAYRMPPAGKVSKAELETYKAAILQMNEELKIAEILMTLETDFLEAFRTLSKDKVKAWLKDTKIIS